jgi:putative flippase GtrA|tara:strand:- start:3363 stop:3734 length:372 start_codon:yes stop_codon:yes gene_type:complete
MIKKQLPRFIIVGIFAVLIDYFFYTLLSNMVIVNIAKAISFILGASFAFIFNKLWTFSKRAFLYKEIFKFTIVYSSSLIVNVCTNQFILLQSGSIIFAFLIATLSSATINFLCQKYFVFNERK